MACKRCSGVCRNKAYNKRGRRNMSPIPRESLNKRTGTIRTSLEVFKKRGGCKMDARYTSDNYPRWPQ